jgi:hypothetical protein
MAPMISLQRDSENFSSPRRCVRGSIDWASSRRLDLSLSPGDVASLTCSARPPNSGWTALASKNYIKLEIVDGSWLAVDQTS